MTKVSVFSFFSAERGEGEVKWEESKSVQRRVSVKRAVLRCSLVDVWVCQC